MNPYRKRIWQQLESILAPIIPIETALDFGSGDGWFARRMLDSGFIRHLTPVDVTQRENSVLEPQLYDGKILPFAEGQFDLVYSIDVLHHCTRPKIQLEDALRCTRRYFLLKDHTYCTPLGKIELCALDEIGNRKFGIPSLYHYQHRWEWFRVMERHGFHLRRFIYPSPCHIGLMGKMTNHLQFIALWEKD